MAAARPSGGEVKIERYVERKWKINAEKVAFAKTFPGRLIDWTSADGKKIEKVVAAGSLNAVIIFSDGTFVVAAPPDLEPADLIAALLAARPFLESRHGKAYEMLDEYIASDKETQRMARLENIMGAIRNNLPQIPELKEELRRFLEDQER